MTIRIPNQDLLSHCPTPKRFTPEPSTAYFLKKYSKASGVYVQRPHKDYKMAIQDAFKPGRSDVFDRRHHDYKGAMTVVAFFPTPWECSKSYTLAGYFINVPTNIFKATDAV